MRVSTLLSQQIGLRTMADQEARMLHTMQQLGSGRRVLTPADDPLAAAQAVNVAQMASMNDRLKANRATAEQNLMAGEQVLGEVTTMLQGVLTRVIEAGNGAYSDAELRTLADTLRQTRESLLGQANATDGNGQYLFSGNQGDLAPYDVSGTPTEGINGARLIQVAQTRQMSSGDVAGDIFGRVPPGVQGYLADIRTPAGQTGTLTFGKVELVDPVAAEGRSFQISFEPSDTAESGLQYRVIDGDGNAVDGPIDYVGGDAVAFGGVRTTLSGVPAAGEVITLTPIAEADIDLFATLDDLIDALEAGTTTPELRAQLSNALATANRKVNLHLDNVLTVRASVGARLNEIDALAHEGESRNLNYQAQLSALEEVDYRAASSQIAIQTVALQAAEMAYLKVQALGLFNRR